MNENEKYLLFAGSYAEPAESGIYVYSLDSSSGELLLLDSISGLKNPNFLDLDHENHILYTVAETSGKESEVQALAIAFSFEPHSGKLIQMNQEATVGRTTCHIQFNSHDRYVVVTSYSAGLVGFLPVLADGSLGKLSDVRKHEGQGVDPERQNQAHPHSAYSTPDNQFVYVPDLGTDRIQIYRPDVTGMRLIPAGEAVSRPAAGPRHLAFHPTQPYVYVINELDSTITMYIRDIRNGMLEIVETISTLAEPFEEDNYCAEIQVSTNGRFVYGSNRGHDSIAVLAVDEHSGRLTMVESVPTQGKYPRNFAISQNGDYLVVANQNSANLIVFRIDKQTGKLQDTGYRAEASHVVCVKFWKGYMPIL